MLSPVQVYGLLLHKEDNILSRSSSITLRKILKAINYLLPLRSGQKQKNCQSGGYARNRCPKVAARMFNHFKWAFVDLLDNA
jgi:hypothetical protein